MKKGQAAMEFLMTYGWAILVVLIAIGALAYFGVLSPEKFLPEKCVIASGSGLFCEDFSIESSSSVKVYVHNILPDDLTGVVVTLTDKGGGSCVNAAGVDIGADDTKVVPLTCSPVLSDKVKADLTIKYTVNKAGITIDKTTTGSLTGSTPAA